MTETINDPITVVCVSRVNPTSFMPWKIKWHNHTYTITKVSLHHTIYKGKTLVHIFSVFDGTRSFRLSFDTESLIWTLEAISDELS